MNPIRRITALALVVLSMCACTHANITQLTPSPGSNPVLNSMPTLGPDHPTVTSQEPAEMDVLVFFTHLNRYAQGIQPFEEAVMRKAPVGANLPEFVLIEFFKGPTPEEITGGVDAITSGFTGFSSLVIQDGIARVTLTGTCSSYGATYTIAQPLMRNLLQFEEIRFVKVYDEQGNTDQPEGGTNSIPMCLQP